MFRELCISITTLGAIQTAFAGKIDIILDLDSLRTPKILTTDTVEYRRGHYGLENNTGLQIQYDNTAHQFRVTGVITEECDKNILLTTYYVPAHEYKERNYVDYFPVLRRNSFTHTFSVDLSNITSEDKVVEAKLKSYSYTNEFGDTTWFFK